MKALLVLLALAGSARAECDRAHCFGIQLHVAPDVVTPAWIATQVANANKHFERLGVGFVVVGEDALPDTIAHVSTRGERDELSVGRLDGKVLHVFVVGTLDDLDNPGAFIYGVTWHRRRDDTKYVILSSAAFERTLAHELGHVFGLPHSTYAISIMNKSDRKEPPPEKRTFADEEIAAMRGELARLVRVKVLADLPR